MGRRKRKSKKKTINYFLENLPLIILGLLLIVLGAVAAVFILTLKYDISFNSENYDPKYIALEECSYTLDEIYKRIENNYIDKCRIDESLKDDCACFSYVVLNFYDFFDNEIKFLASSAIFAEEDEKKYSYYTYDEYQKVFKKFESNLDYDVLNDYGNLNNRNYIIEASLFTKEFGWYTN